MFDRNFYKENLRGFLPDYTEEQLEKRTIFMEQKFRTVKQGPNVIHFDYFGGLIGETDIQVLEREFSEVSIDLSHFDKNGIPTASLNDFTIPIALVLSDKTVQDLLIGLSTNLLWDTIKNSAFFIWKRVQGNLNRSSKRSKVNCGIKMSLNKHTRFEFKIGGDIDDETTLKSIDKILDFLKSVKPYEKPAPDLFTVYNENTGKWEVIDIQAEILKRMKQTEENS